MNLELVTNLLQRNDQVQFWVDMAQEAVRRDEREKIVAWLRQEWNEDDMWGDWFAARIEAGAHLK